MRFTSRAIHGWLARAFAIAIAVTGLAVGSAGAQTIDPGRGVDPSVDYRSLTKFGPWDDRNYQLTAADLRLLADNEAELRVPIPAFFRVELRREFPHLLREGPVQYPRAAVPLFYKRYGGLIQDGVQLEDRRADPSTRTVAPNNEVPLSNGVEGNEITVEVNHAVPGQVIAGANVNAGQEMYYSADGGQTWFTAGVLPNTCCDPTVAWSADGSVAYAASLSGPIGVDSWRSFDGGQTWVDRIAHTPSGSDKEWIHVDISPTSPHKDNVYLTWHNGNVMQFRRSTTMGATYDPIIAFPGDPRGIGSDITTDSAGNVYYFYPAFNNRQVRLLKSTNGGTSFAPSTVVAPTNASFDWPIPSMETRRAFLYTAVDVDRSGGPFNDSIYVAWTDTTTSPEDENNPLLNHAIIRVTWSRDGGATWSAPVRPHPSADELTVDRFHPWIAVDATGNVHVSYYDTQNSTERTGTDFYYNFSTDGGVTWDTPSRVTSQTSQNINDLQEWGDYNGISVFDTNIVPAWTDNRDGPPDAKDVWAANIDNPVAAPNFLLSGVNLDQAVCRPGSLDTISMTVGQAGGFADPVALAYANLPSGVGGTFSTNPVTPPGSSDASVNVDNTVAAGDYTFDIVGSATGVADQSLDVNLVVTDNAPDQVTLNSPANGAADQPTQPTFEWSAASQAFEYVLEIDDDPAFSSIDVTVTVSETSHQIDTPLIADTTYYWRVKAVNPCGDGLVSDVFSFLTADLLCRTPNLAIPASTPAAGIDDVMVVGSAGSLLDLNVSLNVSHTYVGDLVISLTHEETGTTISLIDQPGFPVPNPPFGCGGDDIVATLDDEAADSVELQCNAGTPTINGTFQPDAPPLGDQLAAFDGEDLSGTWTLNVVDAATPDPGVLNEWCLLPEVDVPDSDADGVADPDDNCPSVSNADQADGDSDGVGDVCDNCIEEVNASQCDTNGDGFGNHCDADLDNNTIVNQIDLGILRNELGEEGENDADLDCNGVVNQIDLGRLRDDFGQPPGPSGTAP